MPTRSDAEVAAALENLVATLPRAWQADTAWIDDWDPTNPARGQCGSSALVVQDACGGVLMRGLVQESTGDPIVHYWNSIDLAELDTTWRQFSAGARVVSRTEVDREHLLTTRWLIDRYETLRDRVGLRGAAGCGLLCVAGEAPPSSAL
jgi:hypothetical protein